MPKPSEGRPDIADLLGLGSHSARKSYYPELAARLDELERERNRYKWLFEHAVHGIFQARLGEGLQAANPALARMLGYARPEDLLGCQLDLSGLFPGAEELRQVLEILRREHSLTGYETRLRRQDGQWLDVTMNLLCRPDDERLVEGFVADITERKQAELRLQQLNDQLELRVVLRTEELLAANQHLQQEIAGRVRVEQALREARDVAEEANRSKDQFLAAASHDLLQPLNAARLLISTLHERSLPEAEHHLVGRAHQALEGAEELLTDLLDISRLDQAAVRPDLAVYSLEELLAPLASEFQPVAAAAGLFLQVQSPPLAVNTDARLLGRILRNLLSNACRYTERGGVLLRAARLEGQVRLEVVDTGRGIPEDQLGAIFEEFNQLDVPRRPGHQGVGLGLAIVERITRLLGYPLEVCSRVGQGSVFSLKVPLAGQPLVSEPLRSTLPGLGDPLPGCRLLVIDNEPAILESMAALLGHWDCRVLTARDLPEALQVLAGQPPEAILADYHLDHGQNGGEAVQQLRLHFGYEIPAVLITADRSAGCQAEAARLAAPLLNKPLRPGKLRAVLSQQLAL